MRVFSAGNVTFEEGLKLCDNASVVNTGVDLCGRVCQGGGEHEGIHHQKKFEESAVAK
jgi:hypothetical protein